MDNERLKKQMDFILEMDKMKSIHETDISCKWRA